MWNIVFQNEITKSLSTVYRLLGIEDYPVIYKEITSLRNRLWAE